MYSRSMPALSVRNRVVNESQAVLTAARSSVTYPPRAIRRLIVSRQTTISKNPPREKPFLAGPRQGRIRGIRGLGRPCLSLFFGFPSSDRPVYYLSSRTTAWRRRLVASSVCIITLVLNGMRVTIPSPRPCAATVVAEPVYTADTQSVYDQYCRDLTTRFRSGRFDRKRATLSKNTSSVRSM